MVSKAEQQLTCCHQYSSRQRTLRCPTFTVGGIPVDGGIATPAFTFCFRIQVFTLGVFATNDSLCTEVITCRERDKGSP